MDITHRKSQYFLDLSFLVFNIKIDLLRLKTMVNRSVTEMLRTKNTLSKGPFLIFENLKMSSVKARKVFDERKFHHYSEEACHRSCYCLIPPLVMCGESFEFLDTASFCKSIKWVMTELGICKSVA